MRTSDEPAAISADSTGTDGITIATSACSLSAIRLLLISITRFSPVNYRIIYFVFTIVYLYHNRLN